jgi:Proline dehydrogenase
MEESIYTERSIALYLSMVRNGNTGICIHSYLRRSMRDVKSLLEEGSTIRLVKGAYKENSTSAFPTKSRSNCQFCLNNEPAFQKFRKVHGRHP